MFHTAWAVQALVIFAKVAPAALAWKAGVSPAMVVQALVIFAKVAPVANAWRAGVSPAAVVHALVFDCARGYYHRLAFRRRDACALCKAKRLRRLPGCAAYPQRPRKLPTPSVSQARRLRSLQSKAPSAVARLRSVHHPSEDVTTACVGCAGGSNFGQSRPHGECLESRRPRLRWLCRRGYFLAHEAITTAERFAGETPALFAKQSAFGGCRAAQRTFQRLSGCAAFSCSLGGALSLC